MNTSLFLIAPGLVCLFWAVTHALLASRTPTFRLLFLLFVFIFLSVLGDVVLTPLLDSAAISHIVIVFSIPALIPMTGLYFRYLYKPFTYRTNHLFWIIFPIILATAAIVLTSIIGLEETDTFLARVHTDSFRLEDPVNTYLNRIYYYWTILLFRIVVGLEFLILTGYILFLAFKLRLRPGRLFGFLFQKRKIRLLEIQLILASAFTLVNIFKILRHVTVFHDDPAWSLTLSSILTVLYFLFGFFALFGAKEFISLHDISTALRFNYRPETRSDVAEEIITNMAGYLNVESLTRVISQLTTQHGATPGREAGGKPSAGTSLSAAVLNVVANFVDESALAVQFRHLMREEKLFLQAGLTLGDVAERLDSNKTYVSKMVNRNYKMGFPELLNILRIDYAQRYIRAHADASQEEIAKACGFLSASSFNSTFKRITGFTPKVWQARKDSAGR